MPRPKRSEPAASIHLVIQDDLKRRMEKRWVKEYGKLPQGAWQRFVEEAIHSTLKGDRK